MDPYDAVVLGERFDPRWEPVRRSMGYTLAYARRMNLAATRPLPELSSTNYCLASPGHEYLVYLPSGGAAVVDLSEASGELAVEWFVPATGITRSAETTRGGRRVEFSASFSDPRFCISGGTRSVDQRGRSEEGKLKGLSQLARKVALWGTVVAGARVVFIGLWHLAPGDSQMQILAYLLIMTNLPELVLLKALNLSPPSSPVWTWFACGFVAAGSYLWTYLFLVFLSLLRRLRTQDDGVRQ